MAKRFKLKLSRVITSFNSCRLKDPSTFPSNPVPSFLGLSTVRLRLPPSVPPSKHHHSSSIKRHMSSAFASISCGFTSKSTTTHSLSETDHNNSPLPPPPPTEFHWEREEEWHVVAKMYDETPRRKIYNSLVSGHFENDNIFLPPPPPPNTERKKRRIKKKKKTTPRIRTSSSSADGGLFSSEGLDDDNDEEEDDMVKEETETLVSSTRSISIDYSSPECSAHLETIRESPFNRIRHRKKKVKRAKRYVNGKGRKSCDQSQSSPARLSRFQWLIPCAVEGKVRESFAVVKKSEDPHEDFKKSMMEMILEKQMFEVNDLEKLLQCFLSLNSRHYHGVIVEAFSEIWEDLFCESSNTYGVSRAL
ncbi:hypothetical protein P3X46_029304 [Hevea brasiliensis]|uniref:Transcription repressor n=2 Tax=Hevea brasiliensis TaxID=3981 RepID=A0ABQ9KT04_HEVBR|nr:hypothetical protein P3X46_029304 [Hevea brasiliensis]